MKPAALHKYKAIRTDYKGVNYASKWEARCAAMLDIDDTVHCWFRQIKVPLGPDFTTVIDFLVISNICGVEPYFVEAKGPMTNRFRHVCRLWRKYGLLNLVIRRHGRREEVIPSISARPPSLMCRKGAT